MPVHNATNHRKRYFDAQDAGKIGHGMMGPTRGSRKHVATQAPSPRETGGDEADKLTLAEKLGMTDLLTKPPVKQAEPQAPRLAMPTLAPPATANVEATADPETIVDPPQADTTAALPPVEPENEAEEEDEPRRPLI